MQIAPTYVIPYGWIRLDIEPYCQDSRHSMMPWRPLELSFGMDQWECSSLTNSGMEPRFNTLAQNGLQKWIPSTDPKIKYECSYLLWQVCYPKVLSLMLGKMI